MLVVETIARIRREYFVKGKPIKEIVRDVKVSRNTVRKVIRSQATAFTYDRRVQPMPKLGPCTAELERMLEANETKSKRERLTLLRISEALEVWAMAAATTRCGATPSVAVAPFGIDGADLCAVGVLAGRGLSVRLEPRVRGAGGGDDQGQGRARPAVPQPNVLRRAYPRESQEMVFDAHDRAFRLFQGACRRGIYDNMKTAVQTVLIGKERAFNRASCRCVATTWSNRQHARRERDGRRGRSRTRSGSSAVGSSPRGCASRPTTSSTPGSWTSASPTPGVIPTRCSRTGLSGRCSRTSVRPWSAIAGRSTASTRSRRRCRRPAGALRQQQVQRGGARRRPSGRGPCLRRSHRHPPGRRDRRRACPALRPRPDRL